jgi:hypothetical protein
VRPVLMQAELQARHARSPWPAVERVFRLCWQEVTCPRQKRPPANPDG